MRSFKNISRRELGDAIVEMLDKLDISGSIAGEYSIYNAIYNEQEKAKKWKTLTGHEEFIHTTARD